MSKQDIITSMDINIIYYDFRIAELRYCRFYYMITFAIHSIIVLLVTLYNKELSDIIVPLYSIFVLRILMYKGYDKEIDEIIDSSKDSTEALEKLKKLKNKKGIGIGEK